jgi:hypothetical protein
MPNMQHTYKSRRQCYDSAAWQNDSTLYRPPKASFSENTSVQSTSAAHEVQGHGTVALLTFGDTQGLIFSQETAHTTIRVSCRNENDLGSNNTHRSTKASIRMACSTVCAEQSTPVGSNGRLYIPRFSAIFGCFAYTIPPLASS